MTPFLLKKFVAVNPIENTSWTMCYYQYLFTVTNPEQRRIILFTIVSYNTVVNLLLKFQTAQMISAISTCKLKEDSSASPNPGTLNASDLGFETGL